MSWDIYGNPLRRGYCEVHPDIHQEYPCSVCMTEKQHHEQPHDELEQLKHDFAQQGDYIRHLEAQRNELASQVEVLRKALSDAQQTIGFLSHHLRGRMGEAALMDMAEKADSWLEVLEQAPAACLAQVKAEAGRDGFIAGADATETIQMLASDDSIESMADEYANRIRQGGA